MCTPLSPVNLTELTSATITSIKKENIYEINSLSITARYRSSMKEGEEGSSWRVINANSVPFGVGVMNLCVFFF